MMENRVTLAERRRRRETSLLLPKNGVTAITREPCRERPRLAIYVRLSLDRVASVSIARQRATLEEYVGVFHGVYNADRDYFEDNDLSAKGTVYRPAAEELLRRVIAGEYDGVVVWEFARFMRTVRETHIACALMREHAAELYSFEERHLTLYGAGRIAVEFAADQAEKELLKISARTTAAKAFLAQHGAAPSHCPYGTRKVPVPSPIATRLAPLLRLVPDEELRDELGGRSRADLIRNAARRVAGGDSLRTVTREWNDAGWPGRDGGEWRSSTLAQMLRNPLLAGYATYKGEVVAGPDGQPLRSHAPVLDEDTWADLSATIALRPRRPRSNGESPLRGLLRCGRCGALMARTTAGPRGAYRCLRRAYGGICEGNTIAALKTEAFVVEAALEVLSDPERLAQIRTEGDPQRQAERRGREESADRLRGALERLDRGRVLGEYDDSDGDRRYRKLKVDLVSEFEQLMSTERAQVRRRTPLLSVPDGLTSAQAFDAATPAQRLTVLSELIEHVVVLEAPHRAARGAPRVVYRTERLAITWQQADL